MNRAKVIAVVAVIFAAAILISIFAYSGVGRTSVSCSNMSSSPSPNSGNATSTNSPTASFVIIDSDIGSTFEGMNGSAYHLSVPWPVMHVHLGQKVTILVLNCASSEPHGFAVSHYFDAGVAIATGNSYTLTFTADQKGTFRVYCSIFCSIHQFMQNGQLIVS